MHSDHRRDGKKQQEYRGNKREGLDGAALQAIGCRKKRGNPPGMTQQKTLTSNAALGYTFLTLMTAIL
jgi:hypothetical protein